MSIKDMMAAIADGDAAIVEITRAQARAYTDGKELPDTFLEAMDSAQGEADEEGKISYVVIAIQGAQL